MTSGRRSCVDCGRNSPTGRHVSCHVLEILRRRPGEVFTKREIFKEVWPQRYAEYWPGEGIGYDPLNGAVSTLRRQGHKVQATIGMLRVYEVKEL